MSDGELADLIRGMGPGELCALVWGGAGVRDEIAPQLFADDPFPGHTRVIIHGGTPYHHAIVTVHRGRVRVRWKRNAG